MAKSKPIARAKARKKRVDEIDELMKPKSSKKLERELSNLVDEMDEKSKAREQWIQTILYFNDESVTDIVGHSVECFNRMGPRETLIYYKGDSYRPRNDAELELLNVIVNRNRRWMAVRILIASAEQDIQIGNFKLPKGKCARCGKRVSVKLSKKSIKKFQKPSKKAKK